MGSLRIAVLQTTGGPGGWDARCSILRNSLTDERAQDLDLLVCPEMFATGYNIGDQARTLAEPAQGRYFQDVADLAVQSGVAVLYGYPECDNNQVFNSAACVSGDGELLANHRKLHLSGPYEKAQFVVDDNLTLFDLNGIRIAILICYDTEFPEAPRACALAGAELVCAPTALGAEWQHVAERTIPTRAMENGIFVSYANWAGTENGLAYAGSSCIVGPDGFDMARAGMGAEMITAEISRTSIDRARERLPYLSERRAELLS